MNMNSYMSNVVHLHKRINEAIKENNIYVLSICLDKISNLWPDKMTCPLDPNMIERANRVLNNSDSATSM